MKMLLFAQAADFPTQIVSGNAWVNAGIGGIAVALIGLNGWLLKQWIDERKIAIEQQKIHTDQLVNVINKNNEVIHGNTEAIKVVCKQSDDVQKKFDDIRDRLLKRPCMLETK